MYPGRLVYIYNIYLYIFLIYNVVIFYNYMYIYMCATCTGTTHDMHFTCPCFLRAGIKSTQTQEDLSTQEALEEQQVLSRFRRSNGFASDMTPEPKTLVNRLRSTVAVTNARAMAWVTVFASVARRTYCFTTFFFWQI